MNHDDGAARRLTRLLLIAAASLSGAISPASAQEADREREEALAFFEQQVQPILVQNCYSCHSAETKVAGGLRVDDFHGLLVGSNRGAAIVPGKPDEGVLLKAIRQQDPKLKMPPDNPLSDAEVEILEKWVLDGAAWPTPDIPAEILYTTAEYERLKATHWAWQPLREATPPAIEAALAHNDIDRFVLHQLAEAGLQPGRAADKAVLLRRLSFDLTGLPPTAEETAAFLADRSPRAVETVVDRLLASPAFGERWARHWLDVARYAESTGSGRNLPYPHAWRYRDYVIEAFNRDKPYDQFIQEQVAGDLLPAAAPDQKREQLIATGYLALGVKDVNQRFSVRFQMDNVDEQIDTLTRSVLALTVSCARCHDHKFDPIPTADYYSLAGIFTSTALHDGLRSQMGGSGLDYYVPERLIILDEVQGRDPQALAAIEKKRRQVRTARAEFVAFRDQQREASQDDPERQQKLQTLRRKWRNRQAELMALTDPAAHSAVALGVRDAATIADTAIRLRGEAEQLGPVVPRGFLSLLDIPGAAPIAATQSGRLELAQWLTSPDNALAQRVVVNRVWKHLLGEGLVTTVDNFGLTGATPSHPELLDHLAQGFVNDGWSIKSLVRKIVLSRTYQLSSEAIPENLAADPANRLLWRHTPRRLDAEEIRDSLLATSGQLKGDSPGASAAKDLQVSELRNNSPKATELVAAAAASQHRSLYLPLLRGLVPPSLEVFDFAEQSLVTGRRDTTTIAPQALFLLNNSFVHDQSHALARQVLENPALVDKTQRVVALYQHTLGRSPGSDEISRAIHYVNGYAQMLQEHLEAPVRTAAVTEQDEFLVLVTTNSGADPSDPARISDEDSVAVLEGAPESQPSDRASRDSRHQDSQQAAWASLVQAIYGSAEFRYLR